MAALSPLARIKLFTRHKVAEGFFDDVELVVFPGGDGEAILFRGLLKQNMSDVRSFMQRGGKYLGICMGAYWADDFAVVPCIRPAVRHGSLTNDHHPARLDRPV